MKTYSYKIPGRSIVCDTPLRWLKEMIWVYVIMKIFWEDIDAITPHTIHGIKE